MNYGTALSALRLVALRHTSTVCSCTCRHGSVAARQTFKSFLSQPREQVSYSQYRQMSLLWLLRKIPKRYKEFKKFQVNVVEGPSDKSKFPLEIATYLWLIGLNARVRFTNGKWYTSEVKGLREKRPVQYLMEYNIDAIDAKATLIDYHGMAQIIKLKKLKLLSFEGCPYIDDSCLGRLVHLQDTLTHLNINKCPQITENGLASLHHMRNLEKVNMNDLPRVPHVKVVASMLEDILPNLKIGAVTEEVQRHRQLRDEWRPQPDQEKTETHRQQEGKSDLETR